LPTSTLYIDGTSINRLTANVDLARLTLYNLDGADELQFSAGFTDYPGPYTLGRSVRLDIDGTTRFAGRIVQRSEPWSDATGLNLSYRCLGLKWVANLVPVRHPTRGTGEALFNLSPTDPDYVEDESGLSVGEIIRRILTVSATATDLVAAGVTCYTTNGPFTSSAPLLKVDTMADLARLSVVPNSGVTLSGSKIWNQIEGLIQEWMPVFSTLILPDGTIRILDTRTPTTTTLTLGTDPIDRPDLDYDTSDTFTKVVVRGSDWVEGRYLSLKDGTIQADWTTGTSFSTNAAAESAWTWRKFAEPENGTSQGAVTFVGGTTATIRPSLASAAWPVNKWSTDRAILTLENSILVGQLEYSETRRVTANTQQTAGGTSVITVDYPWTQNVFTRYKLVGRAGATSMTYRRYKITDNFVRDRIRRSFPEPYPYSSLSGTRWVTGPVALNLRNISGTDVEPYTEWPAWFEVWTDPADGARKIVFNEPVVKPWTSNADLTTGGSSVKKPHEIRIFVPVSLGVLEAIKPATGYEGTAYTVDGIERVLYLDLPSWRYKGEQARIEEYAQIQLDTVKNPVVTGTCRYLGYYATAITTPGLAINIAGASTTGKESLGANVRSVSLSWPAGGGLNHVTEMQLSTRRLAWSGDRLYIPDQVTGESWLDGIQGASVASVVASAGVTGFGGFESDPMGRNPIQDALAGMMMSQKGFGAGEKIAPGIKEGQAGQVAKDNAAAKDAAQAEILRKARGGS
jgi:hypothetical protein